MEFKRLKTGVFFELGETNYPGCTWTVAKRVRDIPLLVALQYYFF